jgi:hypothetical protein
MIYSRSLTCYTTVRMQRYTRVAEREREWCDDDLYYNQERTTNKDVYTPLYYIDPHLIVGTQWTPGSTGKLEHIKGKGYSITKRKSCRSSLTCSPSSTLQIEMMIKHCTAHVYKQQHGHVVFYTHKIYSKVAVDVYFPLVFYTTRVGYWSQCHQLCFPTPPSFLQPSAHVRTHT